MTKGDVNVLKRLDKQDKRADRAARRLIRKLEKRKRSKPHAIVEPPEFPPGAFASEANFVTNDETAVAQRRLAKARDAEGHRAFCVDEVGQEDASVLVVVPRSSLASPDLLCERVLKREPQSVKLSAHAVCALQTRDGHELSLGGRAATRVAVRKVHIENGLTVFYVIPHDSATAPPYTLGLDRRTYNGMQAKLARLLGAELRA